MTNTTEKTQHEIDTDIFCKAIDEYYNDIDKCCPVCNLETIKDLTEAHVKYFQTEYADLNTDCPYCYADAAVLFWIHQLQVASELIEESELENAKESYGFDRDLATHVLTELRYIKMDMNENS